MAHDDIVLGRVEVASRALGIVVRDSFASIRVADRVRVSQRLEPDQAGLDRVNGLLSGLEVAKDTRVSDSEVDEGLVDSLFERRREVDATDDLADRCKRAGVSKRGTAHERRGDDTHGLRSWRPEG